MIAKEAAPAVPLKAVEHVEPPVIQIRYASTEEDITAMHRFLMIVGSPSAVGGINVVKSLQELIRVTTQEVAIMALHNDVLVATLGIMRVTWWYNDADFLTDRWHFCLPEFHHGPADKLMMEEAKKIAHEAGLPFVDNGKLRDAKNGVLRMRRHLYMPESGNVAE